MTEVPEMTTADLDLQAAARAALEARDPARTLLLASHVAAAVQDFARQGAQPEVYQAVRRAARIRDVMGEDGVRRRLADDPDGARRLMSEAGAALRLVADAADEQTPAAEGPKADARPGALLSGLSRSMSEAVVTQLALDTEIPKTNRTIGLIPQKDETAANEADGLLQVDPREATLLAGHLQGVLARQLQREAAQAKLDDPDLNKAIAGLKGMAGMVTVGLGAETVSGMDGAQASSLLSHTNRHLDKAIDAAEAHGLTRSAELGRLIHAEVDSYAPTEDPLPLSRFRDVAKARLAAAEALGQAASTDSKPQKAAAGAGTVANDLDGANPLIRQASTDDAAPVDAVSAARGGLGMRRVSA